MLLLLGRNNNEIFKQSDAGSNQLTKYRSLFHNKLKRNYDKVAMHIISMSFKYCN